MGTIHWDNGSAYDFFVSLYTLHNPELVGLRGPWAAGVRSRLPKDSRLFLQSIISPMLVPLKWIYSLPEPKDSLTALRAIEKIPEEEILPTIGIFSPLFEDDPIVFRSIMERGTWKEKECNMIRSLMRKHSISFPKPDLEVWLDLCSDPKRFGQALKKALEDYHEVFFREEENRIRKILEEQLDRAKIFGKSRPRSELLEELSRGVAYPIIPEEEDLVIAPSFWSTPLIIYGKGSESPGILLFGARPADASLIPGEQVPDFLSLALQALGDETRIKILKILSSKPITQVEIARKLRLRPPTITHHLKILRIARLIRLTPGENEEKRYSTRVETVDETFDNLKSFLTK
ncbi:MAG: winged helix-turn-helix transcriptional regulator [Spirochaetales bacterium]|nr:winged helix-turn-helix transcriptional regulator [Spirochaetales bacterium]